MASHEDSSSTSFYSFNNIFLRAVTLNLAGITILPVHSSDRTLSGSVYNIGIILCGSQLSLWLANSNLLPNPHVSCGWVDKAPSSNLVTLVRSITICQSYKAPYIYVNVSMKVIALLLITISK